MIPTVSRPSSQRSSISGLVVDQVRLDAGRARDLDEPLRVRAVLRPDHEQQVDLGGELLDGGLPVRRRVADVLAARRTHSGEAPFQDRHDLGRLVDAQRRLRHVGDPLRVGHRELLGLGHAADDANRGRCLAVRADDFLVAVVSDQDDGVALGGVAARLGVHLRDERTRRVDRLETPLGRRRPHRGRHAVRREDEPRALGNARLAVHEHRASLARGRARRARCGRSACARRQAGRTTRAPARRFRSLARRLRRIHVARRAARASPQTTMLARSPPVSRQLSYAPRGRGTSRVIEAAETLGPPQRTPRTKRKPATWGVECGGPSPTAHRGQLPSAAVRIAQ